jgi:hypothetical protein
VRRPQERTSCGSGSERHGVAIVEEASQFFIERAVAAEERLDARCEQRRAGIEHRFERECQAKQRRRILLAARQVQQMKERPRHARRRHLLCADPEGVVPGHLLRQGSGSMRGQSRSAAAAQAVSKTRASRKTSRSRNPSHDHSIRPHDPVFAVVGSLAEELRRPRQKLNIGLVAVELAVSKSRSCGSMQRLKEVNDRLE